MFALELQTSRKKNCRPSFSLLQIFPLLSSKQLTAFLYQITFSFCLFAFFSEGTYFVLEIRPAICCWFYHHLELTWIDHWLLQVSTCFVFFKDTSRCLFSGRFSLLTWWTQANLSIFFLLRCTFSFTFLELLFSNGNHWCDFFSISRPLEFVRNFLRGYRRHLFR